MTETMKAVLVREHGGVDKLLIEDAARPTIRPDEVLIDVKAAGINHLDLWIRKGVPGHEFPLPMILGTDIAGVVAEKGELVTTFKSAIASPSCRGSRTQLQKRRCRGTFIWHGTTEFSARPVTAAAPSTWMRRR